LTGYQKLIFNKWFIAFTKMYNETLKYIKKNYLETNKLNINFINLRTNHLKETRNKIQLNSQISTINEDVRIKAHILDYAIKLACSNYKSAMSNYKKGNIKQFRIRYWKYNSNQKVMDIEHQFFKQGTICNKIFGAINCTYDGKPFDMKLIETTYKSNCKLVFKNNQYILLVPETINHKTKEKPNKIISLDPGIRKFMTGLSENQIIKIGENASDRIKKYLEIIDDKQKIKYPKKIQIKYEKRYNLKINHLVDELHWKTIKYLTDNYENILIGDMSVKGISSNKKSVLNKMTKRIAYKLKFYQFNERLKYKCNLNKINLKQINESYTSKMCSVCGNYNNNLGASKIYDCLNCHVKMDRDINGCRGIFIKSLYE
jgi:IS605 OrfB family transposase